MRPPGSPADLEQRRRRAIELLERDVPVHAVAASIAAPSDAGSGRIGAAVRRGSRRNPPPVGRRN
jgi:hypothetical protein